MLTSPDQLVARLNKMAEALGPEATRKKITGVGVALKPIGQRAVYADLGDQSFSGWKRGAPIALEVAFKVHTDGQGLTMHRAGKSAGQWRVAQDGRNSSNATGFQGPGINQRTGVTSRTKSGGLRKVKTQARKKWNGYTQGKNTWSDASQAMTDATPELLTPKLSKAVIDAFLGK